MHLGTFENFTECYISLIDKVYNEPEYVSAPRGQRVKEVIGASFTITNPRCRIPFTVGRKFSMSYMVAELVWYLAANNSTKWISNHSKFWKDISDDGTTANSAYGARLFKENLNIAQGRYRQIDYIIEELKKDPDSRRAVMHLRVPSDSIDAKLDVPCTLALQFFIREGKLHQVVTMRSSDLIFGIAYDIPAFTMFQEMIANELGVELGSYSHSSNSLHIYERHFEMVEEILSIRNVIASRSLSRDFGEMPAIQGGVVETLDAAKQLCALESHMQTCDTEEEVLEVVQSYSSKFDQPFVDWFKVLGAARMKKIDKKSKKADDLLMSVEYGGYKLKRRDI